MSYTIAESWAVIHETERLLKEDASRGRHIANARASSTTKPPPATSATDQYFHAVERHLATGKSPAQARRLVAVGQRGLLDNYTREYTEVQRVKAGAKARSVSLARRLRNPC